MDPRQYQTPDPHLAPGAVLLSQVTREFGRGRRRVVALDGVSVTFPPGSFTAVMGPSGSGKSTLLQCASGLDRVSSGRVAVDGRWLGALSEAGRTRLRRARMGFVFQSFNLLPSLTAAQNVELPLRLAGRRTRRAEVLEALDAVGLADRARHRPAALSGGQQQRVAIARSLITRPAVLFADEPTGALDAPSTRSVMQYLRDLSRARGQTVLLVTHDADTAAYASTVMLLNAGRIAGWIPQPDPSRISARVAEIEAGITLA
ncbi:ABC transporter ATP-binding protein [Microbacterium lushaniae]|nr:ABC transporter ATP-binding protein [Microbacterium lushaniae]KAA9154144.1 ABC transporter ATP-binding protein [Microbacterium lushaniae]